MTPRRARIFGAVQVLLGGFLMVEGFAPWIFPKPGRGFDVGHYLGIGFGALLTLMGIYALCTGVFVSRWRKNP